MKSPGQLLQGWELNSVVTVQTGQPWYGNDQANNISGTGENTDRWDFFGNPGDFKSGNSSIPFCTGNFETNGGVTCTQTTPAGPIIPAEHFQCFRGDRVFALLRPTLNSLTEGQLGHVWLLCPRHSVLFRSGTPDLRHIGP